MKEIAAFLAALVAALNNIADAIRGNYSAGATPKKPVVDEEDDTPPTKKKKLVVDEEDDTPPTKKKKVVADEEDDTPPTKKKGKKEATEVTEEELRALAIKLSKSGSAKEVRALIASHGAENISGVDADNYAELFASLKELDV